MMRQVLSCVARGTEVGAGLAEGGICEILVSGRKLCECLYTI